MKCQETLYMNSSFEVECDYDGYHEEHQNTDIWYPMVSNDKVQVTVKWKKVG